MEVVMKRWLTTTAMVLVGFSGPVLAQSLPVPSVPAARDVPGAKELPDPNVTYKVVFDARAVPSDVDDVNPVLTATARYLNTLAKYGVPPEHRKLAVVIHGPATAMIVDNETFKMRNGGHDNANIGLIRELSNAGVKFHVCGQAVLGRKIDPKTIMPEIELDLWALTTLMNLEMDGYVHVGGG
jgi:intracellular sulfur oxidation DsrE/DsrF family protein